MADPEKDVVPDCSDKPKLTDEEWDYVLAMTAEGDRLKSGLTRVQNTTGEPERMI